MDAQIEELEHNRLHDKHELNRLHEDLYYLQKELEELKQSQNGNQGENLEQSQKIENPPLSNGEFITDITKEARYKDLENQIENLESEKKKTL